MGLTLGENAGVTGLDWRTGEGFGEGGIRRDGRWRDAQCRTFAREEEEGTRKKKKEKGKNAHKAETLTVERPTLPLSLSLSILCSNLSTSTAKVLRDGG